MIVGLSKAAVAAEHIRRVNEWTSTAALGIDFEDITPGMLAGIDAAGVAVDSHRGRYLATRLLLAAHVPHVDLGVLAELWHARATVSAALADAACQIDAWSAAQLARAGEDVGIPCAAADIGAPFPSTLVMGQAAAALGAQQLLALAGAIGERPRIGHEIRLDLRRGSLDAFRLPVAATCAADHVLAAARDERLGPADLQASLGELMTACGAGADTTVVLATRAVVGLAICEACRESTAPYLPPGALGPCPGCGAPLVPLRRLRRLRWGEAASAVARCTASVWFRPGDAFALVPEGDARRATLFAFPPPAVPWQTGAPWDDAAGRERFARLPRTFDLARIRSCRIAVLGAGHVGAALIGEVKLRSSAPLAGMPATQDALGGDGAHGARREPARAGRGRGRGGACPRGRPSWRTLRDDGPRTRSTPGGRRGAGDRPRPPGGPGAATGGMTWKRPRTPAT